MIRSCSLEHLPLLKQNLESLTRLAAYSSGSVELNGFRTVARLAITLDALATQLSAVVMTATMET